ncbi:MAG TPA: outer membrane beta-barrel protein [Dongiaceae bacterium]|jgi:hypothetical protein|nr:outer membrane beta-barrel protein [Dongiaceae bacterium]
MKKTLLASALLLLTAPAMAANFNYTYVEGGYGEVDSGDDVDGDALFLGGSVDIQQGFGLIGSFYTIDFDEEADGTIFTVGAQFHTPISNQADFVGSVQLINAEVDFDDCYGDCSEDDTGLLLRGGVRFAIQQNLHLEGDISYIDNDFWDDDELGLKAGLRFFINRQFSLAGGFASDQELDGLFISGRFDL